MPDKKDSVWPPQGLKNMFGKETMPAPPPGDMKDAGVAPKSPSPPVPLTVAQGPMLPPSPYGPTPDLSSFGAPPPVVPSVPPPVGSAGNPPAAPPPLVPPVQPVQQVQAPARPTGQPMADPKVAARQMLADGYKALNAGDLETARTMAFRVREMNVELGATEMGPEQLLQDVQKAAAIAAAKSPKTATPADSHALVKEGRALLAQGKLEEAEFKCNQAAAVRNAHWGLFEDSPEKLRSDVQRTRAAHNREESDRLLIEAHKLFAQGNIDEAKKKAWRAQELHGAYSPFDFGDRPQKLLIEISKAETVRAADARRAELKPATTAPTARRARTNW